MKLYLPAHESIRVELFKANADLIPEHKALIHYSPYNIKSNQKSTPFMTFTFKNLDTDFIVPKSRIIVQEKGLPLMFNSTSGSNLQKQFKTDSIYDSNLKINDRVGKVITKNTEEKALGTSLIERSWTEEITRIITITNDTGRIVENLLIEINDDPASQINFQESDPKADETSLPVYKWKFRLQIGEEKKIVLKLHHFKKEQIKIVSKDNELQKLNNK